MDANAKKELMGIWLDGMTVQILQTTISDDVKTSKKNFIDFIRQHNSHRQEFQHLTQPEVEALKTLTKLWNGAEWTKPLNYFYGIQRLNTVVNVPLKQHQAWIKYYDAYMKWPIITWTKAAGITK